MVSFWDNQNILKLMVVIVVYLLRTIDLYTLNILYDIWINLNKAVTKSYKKTVKVIVTNDRNKRYVSYSTQITAFNIAFDWFK